MWKITPQSVLAAFRRACKRGGVINLHFHDLRHEATPRFIEKGLSIMEVSTITGHQDLRMLKRCTHIRPESLID
ncbi:MAG: tyrosine-type recombinase/integrase [Candidatus Thiodiazotropha sp. (ex Codakia rugifera)]|nr:tyrosine-type recombinase/integrase [Candidatus Thiodiazotropha sp. (ex Codakia rugifera)]